MNHRERAIKTIQEAVEAVTAARVEIGRLDESATIEQIKAAQTAAVDAMMSCSEASGACSAYRVQRTIAASDSELGIGGAIENILTGKGGPINAAQAAELAGLPDNDDHFDDCQMGVGGECDCEWRIVSRLRTPEEQDAADAAIVAAEQDAQHRKTVGATYSALNGWPL